MHLALTHVQTLERVSRLLRCVERDLQVFGSELCPQLHEAYTKVDELRERMEHDSFNGQDKEDETGGQEPPAPPAG